MSESGVIHDIGYQRYSGPRLGRGYAVRSLYVHSLRTAFGFGRSAKAKIFPWFAAGIALLVAVIVTAVRAQAGRPVLSYTSYADAISILVVLFCAVIGPELVSRDLRSGVLPLYFSRPMTRADYALAKLAATVSAAWLLLAMPLTIMFLGGAFGAGGAKEIWTEIGRYAAGLGYAALYALLFGAIATLVGSLASRRAVAAAIIAGFFLMTSAVAGVVSGIAFATDSTTLQHAFGLLSPATLLQGVHAWAIADQPGDLETIPVGNLGPVYGLVLVAAIAVCTLLLLARYRKVAR
ncbi:ABC transporter permease subunit [Hamadaea sp. NPDC051192]|uniref:ABC transporter permease n=1 Tax=Hamadaea sp. NPDC051192 TaxID=3154940 RepID=UPI003412B45E